MKSFTETIDQVKIPDKYKRNKTKVLTSLQILKEGVESMKLENTKAYEFMIDKDSSCLRELTREAKFTTTTLPITLGEGVEYRGITDTNVVYTIRPKVLVKNLQSQYRDLSVFWFLEENPSEIMSFLAEHRFFSVVYTIEFPESIKPTKMIEIEEPVPVQVQEPIKKPVFSYASIVQNNITVKPDQLSYNLGDEVRTVPENYRGGKYNNTEYENVQEYYEKWGKHRMFVMFCSGDDYFSREDKTRIRNIMNNDILSSPKYQDLIEDNKYYYVKIIKNFHYDLSKRLCTLHFNMVFKNEYTSSGTYHVYVDPKKTEVTRISTMFNDIR